MVLVAGPNMGDCSASGSYRICLACSSPASPLTISLFAFHRGAPNRLGARSVGYARQGKIPLRFRPSCLPISPSRPSPGQK